MCEYLEFCFPLNIDYKLFQFAFEVENHASANRNKAQVDKYFAEVELGDMVGPLDESPFAVTHYSPLMTRKEADGITRVIVDLSWPVSASVYSCIPLEYFDFFLNFS